MGSRMDPTKVARTCLSEASSLRKRYCRRPHGLALHLLQPMDLYMKELTLAHILEETVFKSIEYLCQGELGKVEVWTLWDPENITFEIPTGSQNTSRNRGEKCIFHFSPQVLNIETSFDIQSTPLGRTNRMVYSCTGAYSVVEQGEVRFPWGWNVGMMRAPSCTSKSCISHLVSGVSLRHRTSRYRSIALWKRYRLSQVLSGSYQDTIR